MKELVLSENDAGQRLDRFLAKALPHLPPSLIARLIRTKHFRVNGVRAAADTRLAAGDRLALYLTDEQLSPPPAEEAWRLAPDEVTVAYEDNDVLIADKPAGLLCHSDDSGSPDTLIDRVKQRLYRQGKWDPAAENSFAPALANRIDRNTCGLVLAAKTAPALRALNDLIRRRAVRKFYLCTVEGRPPFGEKTLTGYLAKDAAANTVRVFRSPGPGRLTAVTRVRVLRFDGSRSLLECELLTGRTHQIRAQLADAGFPITGDTKYGRGAAGRRGQALCAWRLVFPETDGPLAGLSGRTVVSSLAAEFDPENAREETRG